MHYLRAQYLQFQFYNHQGTTYPCLKFSNRSASHATTIARSLEPLKLKTANLVANYTNGLENLSLSKRSMLGVQQGLFHK